VDKNFIFAFLLILAAFVFFNSDFYNHTLMGKQNPPPAVAARIPGDSGKEKAAKVAADSFTAGHGKSAAATFRAGVVSELNLSPDSLLYQQQKKIIVASDLYIAEFTTIGARAISWQMKGFKNSQGAALELLPENMGGIFNFALDKKNYDFVLFECPQQDTLFVNEKATLKFRYLSPEGFGIEKIFSFEHGRYDVDVTIRLLGETSRENYSFGWKCGLVETEQGVTGRYADNPVSVYFGDDVDHPVDTKDTAKEVEGTIKWVSVRTKYFSGTFMPDNPGDFDVSFRKLYDLTRTNNELNYAFTIQGKIDSSAILYKVILCPNKYSILKSYDIKLEKILFKGYTFFFRADLWFPMLCGLVLSVLNFFYGLIPNYGIAILFLTLLSKIITLPLTLKSSRSMARMKLLQPKMQAIRDKYKNDPLNMNKAVMKMYKDEGVNPLGAGGCLPMILQMPIFIALFVALRKSIELRGAPFCLWIHDLSGPEALTMLPSKILFYGPNVSLLTIIMAVTMFFQSKQTMTDPKQKSLVYMMPIVMLFMLNSMPSGLMLYWAFSNILGIFQNMMIKVKPEDLAGKPKAKKPFLRKLSYNEMLKRMGRK
jgi:YidC/Oxa1 family membrane protein insertase